MRTIRLALAVLLLDSVGLLALSVEDFRNRLADHLAEPRFSHAWWGVHIESLQTGRVLFATNSHRLFQPASTAKLFVAALALDRLGGDYRIPTTLHTRAGALSQGVLSGDLIVRGRGDYSFAARFHQGDASAGLVDLVKAVQAAGIRRIEGDLIGDARWFQSAPWGAGWAWDDLARGYAAEATALVFDDNIVGASIGPGPKAGAPCTLRLLTPTGSVRLVNHARTTPRGTGTQLRWIPFRESREIWALGTLALGEPEREVSLAVPDPAWRFVEAVRDQLQVAGIQVTGNVRILGWPGDPADGLDLGPAEEVARTWSPSLSSLVSAMLKFSQNLDARLLLAQVGATPGEPGEGGSGLLPQDLTGDGLEALHQLAARAGLDGAEVRLVEATGLARQSRVSPTALVGLLRWMDRQVEREAFWGGLPIAGVDGTLQGRFRGTPAAGNLRAKTGTLSDVFALAGRVTSRAGEPLVFALLLNGYAVATPEAGMTALDAVGTWLAELEERVP